MNVCIGLCRGWMYAEGSVERGNDWSFLCSRAHTRRGNTARLDCGRRPGAESVRARPYAGYPTFNLISGLYGCESNDNKALSLATATPYCSRRTRRFSRLSLSSTISVFPAFPPRGPGPYLRFSVPLADARSPAHEPGRMRAGIPHSCLFYSF